MNMKHQILKVLFYRFLNNLQQIASASLIYSKAIIRRDELAAKVRKACSFFDGDRITIETICAGKQSVITLSSLPLLEKRGGTRIT